MANDHTGKASLRGAEPTLPVRSEPGAGLGGIIEPSPSRSNASDGTPASDGREPFHPSLAEYLPLLSQSPRMRGLAHLIQEVARTDATVLVRGESGVGKELVARAIHASSARRDKPFVLVNCAALPAELLETELFGHEKGAFTGAHRRKLGQFEFASRGTICLDEIGELPRSLQAKLLHVLQDLQFSRIGGRELIRADVRVIATTNRDLEAAMHGAVAGSLINGGQDCTAATRAIVHRSLVDDFVAGVADLMSSVRMGDPPKRWSPIPRSTWRGSRAWRETRGRWD
jgi:hypothetical protein